MNWYLLRILIIVFALGGLVACGGDDGFSGGGSSDSTDTGDTTDPTDPGTEPEPTDPSGVAGSISFVSASPDTISLKGTGGTETSTLTFRVLDTEGFGLSGETVLFELNTTTGGITLDPTSRTSDASGYVTTSVSSGTVSTVASVTATLQSNPAISTTSTGPVVSTGVADQNSFSFSAEYFNPEGWAYDGEAVALTIFASDHFNNPVPDGEVVYFQTEGGQIDPTCQLVNGRCSVEWRSSARRPIDGRVTVTATMKGEESFSDNNGNGLLDDGESYSDLPEAFYDYNENGTFDPAVAMVDLSSEVYYEEPRDFNENGLYDPADGEYNGVLCNSANQAIICSDKKKLDVRANLVLIMSGSFAVNSSLDVASIDASGGSGLAVLTVADVNNQVMPYGTTVDFTAKDGLTLLSESSYTIRSSNQPGGTSYSVSVKVDDMSTSPSSSQVNVKIATPKGNETILSIPVTW